MRLLRSTLFLGISMLLLGAACQRDGSSPPQAHSTILRVLRAAVQLTDGTVPLKNPRWSPRGTLIAASGYDDNSLWVLKPDGSDLRKVGSGQGIGQGFSWCADDRALVYRASRFLGRRRWTFIRIVDVVTGREQQIVEHQGRLSLPRWYPEHELLLFLSGDSLRLFKLTVSDSGIVTREVTGRQWAREARAGRLLFGSRGGLFLWEAKAAVPRRLRVPVHGQPLNAVLSPDRSQLAFEIAGRDSVWVLDLDSGEAHALGPGRDPVWSPDGVYVACTVVRGNGLKELGSEIVVYRVADGKALQITRTPERLERGVSWSPDGTQLVYADERSGKLYRAELEYGQPAD